MRVRWTRFIALQLVWYFSTLCVGQVSGKYHHTELHRQMTRRDLSRLFGVESHDEVPEYDIIHPVQVDELGSYVTHELSYPRIRRRNAVSDISESDDVYYKVRAFDRDLHLHLQRNKRFLAPNFRVEVLDRTGQVVKRHAMENCYYTGTVRGEDRTNVALSNCDGLRGLIQTGAHAYLMEPVPTHYRHMITTRHTSAPHVIYKRSPLFEHRHKQAEKESKLTCGTKDDPRIRLTRSLNDTTPVARDGPAGPGGEKYIETLVVVDPKMANFHGEDAAKQYALAACNVASNILRDGSVGDSPLNFVVSRMQILTTPQSGLVINHHAGNTLESFGKWAERNNNPLDNDENHYDYATLFTRYSICKDKDQPCDTLGLTRTRGMCKFPDSVSVNQDNGLMLGMTLAHELGHSLGMNHDGSNCPDGANIMSSFSPGKPSAFEWSACSRNYLKQFLASDDSRCLDDPPTKRDIIDTDSLDKPGRLYDANEQCRLSYGQKAQLCEGDKFLDQICMKLWCEVPAGSGKCKTSAVPAADGTGCGDNKWCRRGTCIPSGTAGANAVNGGWSPWSTGLSDCSRSCGGGVQYAERRCNSPRPSNGGRHCEGLDRKYKICNSHTCPLDSLEHRNTQCHAKNSQLFNDQYYEWEWKPSSLKNKCVLGCFIKGTGLGFAFGNAEDGTNCEKGSADKCIQGQCSNVGCDGLIGSNAVMDRCGVCNGDGSTCSAGDPQQTISTNTTSSKKEVTPGGGNLITSALNWLKKLGYDVDRRGQIATPEKAAEKGASGEEDVFYWATMRSGCSVSCGGGRETTFPECRRTDDGSPVNEEKCDPSKKPPREAVHCNYHPCPPTWKAEGWEDCSRTCNGGNRTREIKCIQVAADGVEYDVDSRLCSDPKPAKMESCNNVPCGAEWMAEPFGECSTSCGRGQQNRLVKCMKADTRDNLMEVDNGDCDSVYKPPVQEYCNVHNPCPGEGGCGGNFTEGTGQFSSPNYPGEYPNNKECVTAITVSPDKVVKLNFHSMQVLSPEGKSLDNRCRGDFVKVMDGDCNHFRAQTRYCGKEEPAPFISTSNKLCVKFFSDESDTAQGFSASYEAIERPTSPGDQCGSILTAPVGLITSPNYPEPYPRNEVCNMTIRVAKGPIKVAFQAFDVGSSSCEDDHVILEEGNGGKTKTFCGNNIPDSFNTSGDKLNISFQSGERIGRPKPGFVATYTSGATPDEVRKSTVDKSGIKTFSTNLDKGLMNEAVARGNIAKPSATDKDVNFLPLTKEDNKDVSKEESDNPGDDIGQIDVPDDERAVVIPAQSGLQNAFKELNPSSESGSGSGNDDSPEGKDMTKSDAAGAPKPNEEEPSIVKVSADRPTIVPTVNIAKSPAKTANASKNSEIAEQIIKLDKDTDLDIDAKLDLEQATQQGEKDSTKQNPHTDESASNTKKGCPAMTHLSCLNLLYSFPCENDEDCFENGMQCCSTKCTYGHTMCVPKISAGCPLQTPFFTGYKSCKDSSDCGSSGTCCLDMAGRHYCHQLGTVEK